MALLPCHARNRAGRAKRTAVSQPPCPSKTAKKPCGLTKLSSSLQTVRSSMRLQRVGKWLGRLARTGDKAALCVSHAAEMCALRTQLMVCSLILTRALVRRLRGAAHDLCPTVCAVPKRIRNSSARVQLIGWPEMGVPKAKLPSRVAGGTLSVCTGEQVGVWHGVSSILLLGGSARMASSSAPSRIRLVCVSIGVLPVDELRVVVGPSGDMSMNLGLGSQAFTTAATSIPGWPVLT